MANDNETDATTQPEAAAESAPKKRLPLALIAIVGGLAIGGGTGAMIVGPMAASALGFTGAPPADSASADHGAEGGEADAIGAPAVHTLDNLVLNPAGSGGARFLLLTVTIEAKDAAAVTAMQERDAELRDIVLSTLSHKSVEELVDVAMRDAIKAELVDAVNARFGEHGVKRLYFPQYVVQ